LGNSTCRLLLLALLLPGPLAAQARFSGTVIRVVAGDTLVVPGAPVQLHRVSVEAQGVIDSTRTDRAGRWRFRPALETDANYLVSTQYAGIEFFTPPLSVDPARPDTGVRIVVADTSSSPGVRVPLASRHLLVQGGDSAGWRGILDVIVFDNRTGFTRIAPDTTRPSVVVLLPPGAREPELADGDIGPEAVRFRDGALEVYSPLAPGEVSLTVQYLLPADAEVGVPFGDTVAVFNLLVDGEGAVIGGPHLEGPIPTQIEGKEFRRWSGPVPGGMVLQLDLRASRATPQWLLAALVGAMAAGLAVALVVARRKGGLAKRGATP
jgi:hypothetical protein